jgi:hypothetical protein
LWWGFEGVEVKFNGPRGIVVDKEKNLYIADSYNHCIRRISPDGRVSTLAGIPGFVAIFDLVSYTAFLLHTSTFCFLPFYFYYLQKSNSPPFLA